MAVLTVDEAKAYLNIRGDTGDVELDAIIAAAEAVIAARVGPLEPTARTDRVRSSAGTVLLPSAPVISVASVTAADGNALTLGDLYLDLSAGIISYADGVTGVASGVYDVTYVAGRADCPPDLLLAVKELVRHLWQAQRGPTARPGSATDASFTAQSGATYLLPYRVAELLAPHLLQPRVA